jgi:hypothetical protein
MRPISSSDHETPATTLPPLACWSPLFWPPEPPELPESPSWALDDWLPFGSADVVCAPIFRAILLKHAAQHFVQFSGISAIHNQQKYMKLQNIDF